MAADALVTSRRLEPPCWLALRRIFAEEWWPELFSFAPVVSGLESSWLREDFAGGMAGGGTVGGGGRTRAKNSTRGRTLLSQAGGTCRRSAADRGISVGEVQVGMLGSVMVP